MVKRNKLGQKCQTWSDEKNLVKSVRWKHLGQKKRTSVKRNKRTNEKSILYKSPFFIVLTFPVLVSFYFRRRFSPTIARCFLEGYFLSRKVFFSSVGKYFGELFKTTQKPSKLPKNHSKTSKIAQIPSKSLKNLQKTSISTHFPSKNDQN